MQSVSVIINAGGKSSRMGTDKALLDLGGQTMIERILAQTKGLGDQIIVTNTPERYAHLGLPMAADVFPDKGALGGLYTAIHASTQPAALVLACDMPFVNRPLLEYMISLAPEFDAVVPRLSPPLPLHTHSMGEGGPERVRAEAEPFRAIYSKACLDPIHRALEAGKMRVISFFPENNVRWLEENEIKRFDPELLTFMNCNTQEELESVRQIGRERGLL
ncbi:MAG TPA: molybdenum cofactor guanylyltransferase [Anaerolineales bacterium]|nr:molybdenum cofactor guanylyltransferase [Anaerolineales bacterium]